MRRAHEVIADSGGAVAPTLALSLVAVIAAGGIAFDYSRLASMDTELQNAADQAALAAASQLTGDDGACSRAAAAAAEMITNLTLMANDGDGLAVVIPNEPACDDVGQIRFYASYSEDPATGIVTKTAADSPLTAKFVEVEVNPREAIYALTPVVAAFRSRPMKAIALSTLGEAYCKVPPIMICNPQELTNNGEFDYDGLDGVGLRLVSVGSSGGWVPGNFGYLDMAGLSNGAPGLREGLGWGVPPTECIQEDGLDTKPGATVTVTDAINTRFDIYDGHVSCPSGGSCPASINSVKDFKRPADANGGNACKMHSSGWSLPGGYYGSSYPTDATNYLPESITPTAMGHPRDICHAVDKSTPGACVNASGDYAPIGNGLWDRDAYFRTNYVRTLAGDGGEAVGTRWDHDDWVENLGLGETPRRYDVYLWEIANSGKWVDGVQVLAPNPASASGSTPVAYGTPVCSPTNGFGDGQIPGEDSPDRRLITVAVVNCVDQGVNGNSVGVQTIGWLTSFLVEPSWNRARSHQGDVYVEVVGNTTTGVQLVSKKVPYLIE